MKKYTVSVYAVAALAGAFALSGGRPAHASIGTDPGEQRIDLNLNAMGEDAAASQPLDASDALRREADAPADNFDSELDTIHSGNAAPNRSPAVLPADDAETLQRRRTMYLDYSEEAPVGGESSADLPGASN